MGLFHVPFPEDITRLIHLAIPCQFPAGARGRETEFPAMIRRFARKLLVLQDIVPQMEKIFPWFPGRQGNSWDFGARPGDRPLQREFAGDEEQGRRQGETQDPIGNAHRHMAADDDPRQ